MYPIFSLARLSTTSKASFRDFAAISANSRMLWIAFSDPCLAISARFFVASCSRALAIACVMVSWRISDFLRRLRGGRAQLKLPPSLIHLGYKILALSEVWLAGDAAAR